ncbi:Oidioi.mRNA.OKI2018_I69.PAR.g12195.t1.cds [Oikopleura dioica]|uniref:Oidioi.mRNA.OKI2018_I69.PAR.g12195.t1.cds n=1 Tax=Oikopleura dioica TaxID=34765 RepID=A0ABN7S3H9_OIKDI|nr:Oidioi.mRNA.OKI2018_I69.PAR.g12195.t1.cds [Oikopleura dioica]
MADAPKKDAKADDENKPIIKDGKRGQILRFGEHDIRLIRRQLHLAVEEELGFTEEEKEIRKRLMDKVLAASLQINSMENTLEASKNHIRDLNKQLSSLKGTCNVHSEIVNDLTAQKKANNQRITELKNNVKFQKETAELMEKDIAKANVEMEPLKTANRQLMNIIQAAEKGHNLLLNTMTEINKEIGSVM